MNQFFVTSTGTEIGKTFVTAALINQLRKRKIAVHAIKPVISDFDGQSPAGSDTAILIDALGLPLDNKTIQSVSPFRYRAPLAPKMAARLEGKNIDRHAILATCREHMACHDTLLVEGVGGSFVPVTGDWLVADWIKALQLPSILVVGSYLGTISHTIATVEAMQARGLTIKAIIVSESTGDNPDFSETVEEIAYHTKIKAGGLRRHSGTQGWQKAENLLPLIGL